MSVAAKRSKRIFYAGCVVLFLGIVVSWLQEERGMHEDTLAPAFQSWNKIADYSILCGAISMLLAGISYSISSEIEELYLEGIRAAFGGIVLFMVSLLAFNVHSTTALFTGAGLLCTLLGGLMIFVGWLRSRLRHQ